jgi:XTP/dITP diphosphohydrolase
MTDIVASGNGRIVHSGQPAISCSVESIRMSAERQLVLGTNNRKKGRELVELLRPLGVRLRTLADFPQSMEVEENGSTFAENAALKATQQAIHLRAWVLGEDSGLAVDALDGAPGLYSARFAGPRSDDDANNRLLLERLRDIPLPRRTAHYVCHLCLSDPQGRVRATCEARCHGRITHVESGTSGFGYDPLFELLEYHRTFGQLGATVKSALSHRARGIELLLPQLRQLIRDGDWPPEAA